MSNTFKAEVDVNMTPGKQAIVALACVWLTACGGTGGSSMSTDGAATVSWNPPTQNTDGSTLTDLKGYKVYYGIGSSNLSQVIDITKADATSAVITNLSPGTWYFAVTAYSATGAESERSQVTSKHVN